VVRRLIFRSHQSPGDLVVASAAIRDLHLAHPGQFLTDVRTSADELFLHNPYITRLNDSEQGVESIDLHYPLIHQSNQRPLHFLHGYALFLEERLGVRIPVTQFRGDIHLAEDEKVLPAHLAALGVEGPFWLLVAGGKYDFTAKWVNPSLWGELAKHFEGRITFVQCGEAGHWHPPIPGALNAIGRTGIRDFVRLIYHSQGVACGVTFAMHLAAAVPARAGAAPLKACVVVAGGREPAHWEAYPGHAFLDTVGRLPCCATGGCWKSRCQLVGDGDAKDHHDVCERPVQVTPELRIPQCINMITAADVIRAIERYYEGGMLQYRTGEASRERKPLGNAANETGEQRRQAIGLRPQDEEERRQAMGVRPQDGGDQTVVGPQSLTPNAQRLVLTNDQKQMTNDNGQMTNILIIFSHGLGDAVQLTSVLLQLRHYRPEWVIDVAAGIGKHSAFHGLCRRVFILDREHIDRSAYAHVFELAWHECHKSYPNHPSTKAEQCLLDVFGLTPVPNLCRYEIQVRPAVRAAAERYLESLCPMGPTDEGRWPVVLIHYQGNSSAEEKNLPHELIQNVCEVILAAQAVPVILDWDRRTPLADGVRIHNPGVDHPLWASTGTGDAEMVAALIAASTLVLAVDSGPMHIAGATRTATIAVWTRHPPLHYFGHAPNVFHLVPEGHRAMLRGDRAVGAEYFAKHYDHATYSDLSAALLSQVQERLPRPPEGLAFHRGFWVRRDNARQDLVVVQDVAEHDCYRMAEMLLPGPTLIDAGAHIGTAAATFHKRYPSARIIALECCAENMPVLRRNVGRFATVVQAALSYEPDVALLNAVYPDCRSTGGSVVITRRDLAERLAQASRPAAQVPRREPPGNAGNATMSVESATGSVGNAVPGVPSSGIRENSGDLNPEPRTLNPDAAPRLGEYWVDTRPMRTITLETLMAEQELDWIDVLKLDCEGCELDLLDQCQVLDRVGMIVGEFHGRERFLALVAERLPDWKFEILRDGDPGTFWLTNPAPQRSQESGDRSQEKEITAPGAQSDVDLPQTVSLRVYGRQVEFTAHHALRFTTDVDGSLIPALYFRGRAITQPWSLELAGSGTRKDSGANVAVPERARDAAEWPAIRPDPQPAIRNPQSFCRHLGGETGLRECKTCQGHVRVKTFACSHPAHGETTLAECGTCADYETREPVIGGGEPLAQGS